MDIKIKWFYRLGFLLLLFIVIFIFIKLSPVWKPVIRILLTAGFPFLGAAFVSYLLYPFVEKLHRQGLQRGLSVLIIYVIFFGGTGYGIYKGFPAFLNQLKELSENIPRFIELYDQWAGIIEKKTKSWPLGIHEHIDKGLMALNNGIENFIRRIWNFFIWLADAFFLIVLIPFIAFYMLKDIDYLKKAFWSFIPERWRKPAHYFIIKVDESLGNYIRGQLIVCLTVGIVSSFFFWLMKLEYPLLLGSFIGITNVIPYFGPIIGIVPAVAVAVHHSVKMIIFVILFVFGLQFLEGNVLSPLIVGKSLRMHPLLIIFSILIGGEAGGIIGLIVAVPIVAVIKTAGIQAIEQFKRNAAEP